MIKVKDGYAKLVGTTYLGSANHLLRSNGDVWEVHTGRNNEANKIVRTDGSGYLQTGWISTTSGDMGTTSINRVYCSNDSYIRYKTPANFFSSLTNNGDNLSITIASQNRTLTVLYARIADLLRSKGTIAPQTGRTLNLGDVYSYHLNTSVSGGPTTNAAVIGFGKGTSGTVEIAGEWTSGRGLWVRALRDTTDNWYAWDKVLTQATYTGITDSRYYTKTLADERFVNVTGDTMTGPLTINPSGEVRKIVTEFPSYASGKPVQLLSFYWYTDKWSIGNIRSGSTPSNGLGFYYNNTEKVKFTNGGTVNCSGFIKLGSSDSYVLLGGGGHKALSTMEAEYDARYVNVVGDTMTGALNMNGRLIINPNGYISPTSTYTRRSGMYGVYDSYKTGHIWSMGASYVIPEDGTDFGNLYGLAYKHTNNATGGTMAGGHQTVWCVAGSPKAAMGQNGVWAAGGFYKAGSNNNYALLGSGGHLAIGNASGNIPISNGTVNTNLNADLLDGLHSTYFDHRYYIGHHPDYRNFVILLFNINAITTHRINGRFYSTQGGGGRYISTDVDLWYSRWSSTGFDRSINIINKSNLGSLDLVTCIYNGKTYLALKFDDNDQAKEWYFNGTGTESFTMVEYYNRQNSTVINSEIYNSLTDVNSWNTYSLRHGAKSFAYTDSNVASATKLATARTINGTSFDGTANITTIKWGYARTLTLTGSITGSATIDGSGNVSMATTYLAGNIGNLDARYVNVTGDTMTGQLSWTMNGVTSSISNGNSSYTHYNTNASSGHWFNKNVHVSGNVYGGSSYNRILAFKDEINSQVGGSKSAQMNWASWDTGTYGGAIQIREQGLVTNKQSAWGYSPALTFHWGNRYAKRFGMRSDGQFAVDNVPISLSTHNHNSLYVTALGTNGNYVTWTKNGTTNNLTVPYATNADKLDNYHGALSNAASNYVLRDSDTSIQIGRIKSYSNRSITSTIQFDTNPGSTQYFQCKPLGAGTDSYMSCVILLMPVLTVTNTSSNNFIDGKFYLYKSGGNVYDVVDLSMNQCYNAVEYHISSIGQNGEFSLCRCTYGGINYYAIKVPYHANPYTHGYFIGLCRSDLAGGSTKLNLPLYLSYYKNNTSTATNTEINNSITSTLTTSIVTSVTHRQRRFSTGIIGNSTSATQLQTARTLWGQSFNGTANVSGNMSSVGSISMNAQITGGTYITTSQYIRAAGELQSTSANSLRIVYGNYGVFWRNDGSNYYLMTTASGSQYGSYNSLRPFYFNLASGRVTHGHGLTVTGDVTASSGFKKGSSSDSYVLLGGGGHKAISDFAVKNHNHNSLYVTALGTSGNYVTWTKNGTTNNLTVPYAERARQLSSYGQSPNNSHPGYGARIFYSWNIGQANNATAGYSNGITIGSNPGDTAYGFLIVLNMWDDRTYTRRYNSGWLSWKTLAWTSDILNPADYYWANIRISASSSTGTSPTFSTAYTSNWFRSTGNTGWYSQTYGGGWYMSDSTWIRTYGSKSVYQNTGLIRTDGYLVTNGGITIGATSPNNDTYKLYCNGLSYHRGDSYYTAAIRLNNQGNNSIYCGPNDAANTIGGALNNLVFSSWNGVSFTTSCSGLACTNKNAVSINCRTGLLNAYWVYANGFHHRFMNSNNYVLLAAGSYKDLGDFAKGNAGASNRGVYVAGGTVTAMTYYLNATVNSGTSGKLAYYSGANTLSSYTSTVGRPNCPIYFNGGVPTTIASTYVNYSVSDKYSISITQFGRVVVLSGWIDIWYWPTGSSILSFDTSIPYPLTDVGGEVTKYGADSNRGAVVYIPSYTRTLKVFNSNISDRSIGRKFINLCWMGEIY